MAASPVPVLMIVGLYVAFFMLIVGTAGDTYGMGAVPEDLPSEDDDFGGWDIIGDIVRAVFGFIKLLFGALTFNVEGAPLWVRIPISTGIITSLLWSAMTLIRGT